MLPVSSLTTTNNNNNSKISPQNTFGVLKEAKGHC